MIEQYFRENYNILVKRIQARHMQLVDAEDVVQEAFVRAIKYSDSFNPERLEIGAWFNTILNNAFKDYRHANFTGDFSFTEEFTEEAVDGVNCTEKAITDKDMVEHVKAEMSKLSNTNASIVQLSLLNGYKLKEVAQVLDLKLEHVRKTLFRFKKSMREKYDE